MNNNNFKKRINSILIVATVLLIAIVVGLFWAKKNIVGNTSDSDKLVITNLDVGKADAAIIEYDGMCGIIDTGTKDAYSTIKDFLKEKEISTIDFMIITHYDKDHVGSAVKLLEKFDIKELYLPDYVSEKTGYADLMEAITENDNVHYVSENALIQRGNLSINIIPPSDPDSLISDENNMDNNMSLLCMLNFGNEKFLFTGDVEESRITQILESGIDISADWVKMPHHGAYKDNLSELLSSISPKIAIISTGEERPLDNVVISLLSQMNINYYSTENGNIVTISDGNEITVKQ